ncbi:putative bulb-type lectin domain-containing protein [Arabidopsis thaliana]
MSILCFFKTTASSRNGYGWYLGIWYKSISERTYGWVANRDNPLSKSIGTLKISYANLVLLDHSRTPVWSKNLTRTVKSPVVAELLDNGNFVLRDSKINYQNRFLWQSFDYPVDTLLPEMKIGRDLKTGYETFLSFWRLP